MDLAAAPAEEQVEGPREVWAAADLEAPVWGLVVQARAWEAVMLVEEVQEWEAGPTHPEWAAVNQVIPVRNRKRKFWWIRDRNGQLGNFESRYGIGEDRTAVEW